MPDEFATDKGYRQQLPKTNTTPNIYCYFVHFITTFWSGQINNYIKQQQLTFSICFIRGKRLLGLKGNRGAISWSRP
jgi:hypothetical protein